jgi:hypothetical protein
MSLFLPNIPQPPDNLDFSQGQLLSNNQGLDTVFGIEHYKFSDATANKGFHNKVTTPNYVISPPSLPNAPPTTSASPIFYGFTQLDGAGNPTTQLPVLQYSLSTNNTVASPVTFIQSQTTGISLTTGATTNVLVFTGIVRAYGTLYIVSKVNVGGGATTMTAYNVYWDGTNINVNASPTSLSPFVGAGNQLQIKNNSSNPYINIYWTLVFYRIDTV